MAGLADSSFLSHLTKPNPSHMDAQGAMQGLKRPANGDDDVEMESEDEGGVLLGSDVDIITDTTYPSEVVRKYHQANNLSESDPSSCKWKLPVPFMDYPMKQIKKSSDHPIEKIYKRHVRLINKHWNSSPEHLIPDAARDRTPYSLAMLNALRTLASKTKRRPDLAQSLLEEAWRTRTAALLNSANQIIKLAWTRPDRSGLGRCSEEWIQENMLGLMTADVEEAGRNLKRKTKKGELKTPRRIAQKKAKLAREAGGLSRSLIAERVTANRRAAKLAAGMNQYKDELIDVQYDFTGSGTSNDHNTMAVPPNSPTAMFHTSNAHASPTALRQLNSRHNEQMATEDDGDEGVVYKPTKRMLKQDKQMSNLLNKIDFELNGPIGKRKHKKKLRERLQHGGWSREGGGEVAMPSERFDFNSLPSLRGLALGTDADELAKMGQLPLPEQTPYTLPLRSAMDSDSR